MVRVMAVDDRIELIIEGLPEDDGRVRRLGAAQYREHTRDVPRLKISDRSSSHAAVA